MSGQRLLVIIPTYNEADNIASIYQRLRATVAQADVLVVDDNSPDGTGQIADGLADGDRRVHVMHRRVKNGLGAAYLQGFRWGLAQGYDILVELDADGQHAPEELPRLLAGLDEADLVKGSRYVPGGRIVNWPKSRQWLSRLGSAWTRVMLGLPVRDVTGGFNAIRADALADVIDQVASAGFNIQVDLTYHMVQAGHTVVEVPITFVERRRGASKMTSRIVVEALAKTTAWALRRWAGQLSRWLTGSASVY